MWKEEALAVKGLLVYVYVCVNMHAGLGVFGTEICLGPFWVFLQEKKPHSSLNKPLTLGRLIYSPPPFLVPLACSPHLLACSPSIYLSLAKGQP